MKWTFNLPWTTVQLCWPTGRRDQLLTPNKETLYTWVYSISVLFIQQLHRLRSVALSVWISNESRLPVIIRIIKIKYSRFEKQMFKKSPTRRGKSLSVVYISTLTQSKTNYQIRNWIKAIVLKFKLRWNVGKSILSETPLILHHKNTKAGTTVNYQRL